MDKFDIFINKNANAQPTQYITFRQKKIAKLLKKIISKVVTIVDILNNV